MIQDKFYVSISVRNICPNYNSVCSYVNTAQVRQLVLFKQYFLNMNFVIFENDSKPSAAVIPMKFRI